MRRRDALYDHLHDILDCASVHQVETIMRQIHGINLRLRTYFVRDHEPKELFAENEEDEYKKENPFKIQKQFQEGEE